MSWGYLLDQSFRTAGLFDDICPATIACYNSKSLSCSSWNEARNNGCTWNLRKVCLCHEASDMISCRQVLFCPSLVNVEHDKANVATIFG